jgi:hypothetical protein
MRGDSRISLHKSVHTQSFEIPCDLLLLEWKSSYGAILVMAVICLVSLVSRLDLIYSDLWFEG